MSDLALAVTGLIVASLATFAVTWRAARRLGPTTCHLLAILTLFLMAGYIAFVWDKLWLVRWLPVSSLIVVANWFPILTAVLAALVWRRTEVHPWRRTLNVSALFAAATFSVAAPLWGDAPECGDQWLDQSICLQTTDRTCSPACAATLLKSHGIPATEQEMAELCLTRRGTTWMGLYRGLKRKTEGTGWDVEVRDCSLAELRQMAASSPVILRVGLERQANVSVDFQRELGWRPGLSHSIVLLKFGATDLVEVADPSPDVGREHWPIDELRTLWRGQAIRLVPRH